MSSFNLYAIPEEMRRIVFEKTSPVTFARFSQTNKFISEECAILKRSPIVDVHIVTWSKKQAVVQIEDSQYFEGVTDWKDVSRCGYRLRVNTVVIRTDVRGRLETAMVAWKKHILSIDSLTFEAGGGRKRRRCSMWRQKFPLSLGTIPLEMAHRLIAAGKPKRINLKQVYDRYQFEEYVSPAYHPIYAFKNANGLTDEVFLSWNSSLQLRIVFHADSNISSTAVLRKIKEMRANPIKGKHFILPVSQAVMEELKVAPFVTTVTHHGKYFDVCGTDDYSNWELRTEYVMDTSEENLYLEVRTNEGPVMGCEVGCFIVSEKEQPEQDHHFFWDRWPQKYQVYYRP